MLPITFEPFELGAFVRLVSFDFKDGIGFVRAVTEDVRGLSFGLAPEEEAIGGLLLTG